MRILVTTIVIMVGMMFATTGFAGNEAEKTDAASEEMPAVEAAPPETPVAAPIEADTAEAGDEEDTDAE